MYLPKVVPLTSVVTSTAVVKHYVLVTSEGKEGCFSRSKVKCQKCKGFRVSLVTPYMSRN